MTATGPARTTPAFSAASLTAVLSASDETVAPEIESTEAVFPAIIASLRSMKTLAARILFSFDLMTLIFVIRPESNVTSAVTSPCFPTPVPVVVTGAAAAAEIESAAAIAVRVVLRGIILLLLWLVLITILRKTDLEIGFYPECGFGPWSRVSLPPSKKFHESTFFPQIVDKSHSWTLETLYMELSRLPAESMVQKWRSRAIPSIPMLIDKHDF